MALNRSQILGASDLKTELVNVPEWGGDVIVSGMTGAARDAWEQSLVTQASTGSTVNMENMRARLVVATVVDESGNRLFTAADVAALGAKSGTALDRVCKVAQRLNGLTDQELEDIKGN
jgi:hypothetical protein